MSSVTVSSKPDGEIFGGSNGFNGFYPHRVGDNPYVRQAITSFKVFNKAVPIGGEVLAIDPGVDSLILPYRQRLPLNSRP
jgi:hypothetical protein